jgi:hypothetical protein
MGWNHRDSAWGAQLLEKRLLALDPLLPNKLRSSKTNPGRV